MFKQLLGVALLAVCVSAGSIDFDNCGDEESAIVTDMRVEGCDAQPCVVYKGSSTLIEVDATAKRGSNTLPFKITALVVVPITILEGDACANLTKGDCPAEANEEFTYVTLLDAPPSFPTINTQITGTVRDDNDQVVICTQVRVQIRDPPRNPLHKIAQDIFYKNANVPSISLARTH